MFSVFFSNRFEVLLDALLDRLDDGRPGPFGQRCVVTPDSALRHRIELAVAAREGVCANVAFDYPGQWLWRQIGRVVDVPERSPFARAPLAWRLFDLLEEGMAAGGWVAAHPRLEHYLASADMAMRFEFASRVAGVFDHYLTYRPGWLEDWLAGRVALEGADATGRADEAWQAELWRRAHAAMGIRREHPAALFLHELAKMDAAALAAAGLPATVHVFGLPSLPPLYLDLLRQLARAVDVRLYVLNPCAEFWFEIVDARRLSWLASRQSDLFHETGNRLLAAWGRQTQAYIGLLFEGEHEVEEEAAFVRHPGKHLLARLHNAILELDELPPGGVALAADDRSIEVHVCHSRARELEVLHDRLLGLFRGANPPRPEDIVVLAPDLEAAAPLIDAVFGTAPASRRIPWRITGLRRTRNNPVARVLDLALELVAGRFPASRVFDLLQQPPVAAHFGLDAAELETVRAWISAAGIRWGLDAAQRAGFGFADDAAHTLDDGLHRLFLAWAAGDAAQAAPLAGRIGAAHPEGHAALALGRFWRYAETLRHLRDMLGRAWDAEGWRHALNDAVERLTGDAPQHADALREVRAAIAGLGDSMVTGGLRAAVPLDVVRPALAATLDDPARGGVPGGSVTFAALSALRNLPYRAVCVIGLDRDAFPGIERPAEFDLMAARPRKGDRQRGDDERNLFLDTVLAARDVLYLSYPGRSVRDGGERPPSVLVDELLDTLASACAADPASPGALADARRRLTVVHPLQAFSADYFVAHAQRDPRLVSYRADYAAALAASWSRAAPEGGATEDRAAAPFFAAPLPPPDEPWRSVGLARLTRFFRQPCRYLLRERLGIDLPKEAAGLDDVEPFSVDKGARDALAARLLPVLLARGGADGAGGMLALARAGGEYPAGAAGEAALAEEVARLGDFAAAVAAETMGDARPAHHPRIAFALDGEPWTLTAAFGSLRARGQVRHRYDDRRAGDYLDAWLAHLALCAAPPPGMGAGAPETRVIARDGCFRLAPVPAAEAQACLAGLLALYRDGLTQPLPFFPKSAWAYVRDGGGLRAARKRWSEGDYPEQGEAAYRLALRGQPDPLDERFETIAAQVLGPLFEYLDDDAPLAAEPFAGASGDE